MTGITINGTWYDVRIDYNTLQRTWQVISGVNAGTTMSGREIPDIIGTKISYSMTIEPNPSNRVAYDNLYDVLNAAVESVSVRVPYGQVPIVFDARVVSATDTCGGTISAQNIWKGLRVTFVPTKPQKMAT